MNVSTTIYSALKDLVDNKVYPLVAENGTTFPFIIYKTTASRPENEKDRLFCNWEYNVEVNVCDVNYDNLLDLTDSVILALENIDVENYVEITDVNETFHDDAYVKTINVIIK